MSRDTLDIAPVKFRRHSVTGVMSTVMLALIPGSIASAWMLSPVVLINIIFAVAVALTLEAAIVALRGKPVYSEISDGSIAVAAWLLALAIPPTLPLWQLAVGVLVMVTIGKHVYGGLGRNPFNPAMVAYAVLLVSFPQPMTLWFASATLSDVGLVQLIVEKSQWSLGGSIEWDSVTRATPLEQLRTLRLQQLPVELNNYSFNTAAAQWMWINIWFLIGGAFLLQRRIIQWQIPTAMLSTIAVLYLLQILLGQAYVLPLHYALLSGSIMLGAFFIATDPVTAASSHRGKLLFGAGIGCTTFVIRQYGGYPEGIAFAVLLMNLCVPLIDHFFETRSE